MRVHSLSAADTAAPARRLLWLPPPAVLSSLVLLVLGILLTLSKGLADPDYFWHIATGNLILDSGRIPSVDPFSLTWQGRPWVLHEWLSEALMTALVRVIGALPTLGLFGTLLPLGFGVLGFTFLAQRLPLRAVMLSVLFAAAVAFPYATIRPQVISWFLLSVLLAALLLARPGRSWLLVACVPLFTVWANLHGLWVVGLATFGWYVLATLFRATPMRERRVTVALVGVACVAATLLTPSGLDGLLYPLRYIDAGDWGLAHIPEWASPNFHDLVQVPLLLWIALAPILGRSSPGWLRVLQVIGIVLALLANRNAPVAAVLGLPAVAIGLAQSLRTPMVTRSHWEAFGRRAVELAVASGIVVAAFLTIPVSAGERGLVLERYPVEGVSLLEQRTPHARVFAEYGWGGYVIYRLHDSGGLVFVDGRNDMYDQSILETYSRIRAADAGWEGLLDQYQIDAVLLPPNAPLAHVIDESRSWCEAYRDEREVLATRCQ